MIARVLTLYCPTCGDQTLEIEIHHDSCVSHDSDGGRWEPATWAELVRQDCDCDVDDETVCERALDRRWG